MKNLIFLSTEPYSGKTGMALNVAREFETRGRKVGFFKPVGNLPLRKGSEVWDRDAVFAKQVLHLEESAERICPVILTSKESGHRLREDIDGTSERVVEAFKTVSEGKDLLVMEGSGHINDGRLYHVSAVDLVSLLDLRAVLVIKLDNPYEIVDDVLVLSDRLGDHLAGVVFNWVKESNISVLKELIIPFLEKEGISCFGVIPRDESLVAVSVKTLARALGGRLLCAEDKTDKMIESFMVGAMGQEQALRFFRRRSHKAVITGGDRTDVQLAALETQTACLILTGNYAPPATVLAVAESKGVPIILVDMDTLSAVERTENIIGQMRIDDEGKLNEMQKRMKEFLDIDRLCEAAG